MATLQPSLMAEVRRRAALIVLIATGLSVLDGCAVVKGIFNVGVGVGEITVLTILALGVGAAALVSRRGEN